MAPKKTARTASTSGTPAPATEDAALKASAAGSPTADTSADIGSEMTQVQQAILSLDRDVRQSLLFIRELSARAELMGTFMEALTADMQKLKRAVFEDN